MQRMQRMQGMQCMQWSLLIVASTLCGLLIVVTPIGALIRCLPSMINLFLPVCAFACARACVCMRVCWRAVDRHVMARHASLR